MLRTDEKISIRFIEYGEMLLQTSILKQEVST
jgi:hypothetical protein